MHSDTREEGTMSFQNPVFIPGPTNIPEDVRRACDMPTLDHRSPLFGEILHPARSNVQKVLKSKSAEVFFFPSTGTGGWETALTNTLSPGDKVLAARNGMFSHRWIDMCNRHGLNMTVVEVPWGKGIPADRYEEILTADTGHEIRAVLATHNETATGVKSDIAAVRRALDAAKHPALLLVDGVSSIGSMDFRMDDWGVDIAVTGSQKGFMLPAGLAIVAFSKKAMASVESAKLPRTFFDIRDMAKSYAASGFPYTPPVGLLNGLNYASNQLLAEGLENVFARHARIAQGVRAAVGAWGLKLCAASPDLYSDTVSAIRTPEGFNATRIVEHAAKSYQVAFGTGLGEVAGKVFRIGHLGSMTDVMALAGIATAEMVMADLGLDVKLGSGVAAAQQYYRTTTSQPKKAAA
jgi:alanine-glyoxylate transaminase/serine-glyoxylate transaminase/serine-pyruvate transaminase